MFSRVSIKMTSLLFMLVLLGGCVGKETKPTRYYLIDAASSSSPLITTSPRLEIIDLHLPQYLERFHIATRSSDNRLRFSDNHQWGENLRKNLLRTMSRNLSRLLGTIDVGTPLNRSASSPDYRLQVYIEQFELDVDKRVKLAARWQLSVPGNSEPLGTFAAELQSEVLPEDGDYDAMVAEMQALFASLSRRIAENIAEQESVKG